MYLHVTPSVGEYCISYAIDLCRTDHGFHGSCRSALALDPVVSAEELSSLRCGVLGDISYMREPCDSTHAMMRLREWRFFPFGVQPPRCLVGRGLADRVQLQVALHLGQFDGQIIHNGPSGWRQGQLRRLGIAAGQWYDLRAYAQHIVARVPDGNNP